MITKKHLVITALLSFCIAATLFMIIPIAGQEQPEYDPWLDINDDGYIGIDDIFTLASHFGAEGEAINKTALLLEMQANISSLCTSLSELQAEMDSLTTFNCTWASDSVVLFTNNTSWQPIPKMKLQITLNRTSSVRIVMSASPYMDVGGGYIRALIDSNQANPGDIVVETIPVVYRSMEFFMQNIQPGIHTIEMQALVQSSYSVSMRMSYRILTVSTFPLQ
jgi:hypothetical protein